MAGSEGGPDDPDRADPRPSVASRRVGYAVAVVYDAALLYLVTVWPGWQAVSFLTADTRQVLGLVNLSLAAGLVANLAYLVGDAPVVKSMGELVTTGRRPGRAGADVAGLPVRRRRLGRWAGRGWCGWCWGWAPSAA
jgi:hypothetical protein